jgi:nucleotide-binding universal stress UspA family protein
MERILVCMDGTHGAWEALSRSIALAGRIDARISVLRVLPLPPSAGGAAKAEEAVRDRLELRIEAAKAEGVRIQHFVAEGAFEEEVIRFVEHDRTTLLVVEASDGEGRSQDAESTWLQRVRHRVSCRVEVVSPKKNVNLQTHKG